MIYLQELGYYYYNTSISSSLKLRSIFPIIDQSIAIDFENWAINLMCLSIDYIYVN